MSVSDIRSRALARARLYQAIRQFFAERNVLEVETPLLCEYTVTDPHIHSFSVPVGNKHYYLQTSPEYAMKRLLANGSGSIYQITKSFRQGEAGKKHHPEFSMLEWYRVGFNHHDLMDELDALLQATINAKPAEKITYRDLFLKYANVDPFSDNNFQAIFSDNNINATVDADKDTCLDILLSHCIEPHLGFEKPLFVHDFPASQAALAKMNKGVAERFELYINGLEIANGFHELTDASEQEKRFQENQAMRRAQHKFVPDIDVDLIKALKKGLPDCAGVAVGLDRLLMVLAQVNEIRAVL